MAIEAAVGPQCPLAPARRTRLTVSRRKRRRGRCPPSRRRDISTSPVPAAMANSGLAPLAGIAVVACPLLGQSVGLADGGVQVNGQGPVAGSRPGLPRPGQQLAAHPVELTDVAPAEARRKVPRVDGALTVPPRVQAVPPVRNTSASSMQSPPASAEATSVIILSPEFARPGARSRRCWTSSGRPNVGPSGAARRCSCRSKRSFSGADKHRQRA